MGDLGFNQRETKEKECCRRQAEGRVKDLGLGVDLSPSVQQQTHHDHVATSGGDVQGSDAVLQEGGRSNQFVIGSVVEITHFKSDLIAS